MSRAKLLLTACCALGLTAAHGCSRLPAQPPETPANPDMMKRAVVENETTRLVAESAPAAAENPTVEPGKVKWHRTLADAQAAAEKSGRPVLLFHMMGQLDKQFC